MGKLANVRFGSQADMCGANGHVRFTPNSRHSQMRVECPISAISGHHAHLLDYFVGSSEQLIWN
jgi:hypothetical protein